LSCGHHKNFSQGDYCCLPSGASCTSQNEIQCCSSVCDVASGGKCFCKANGDDCNSGTQCCSTKCVNSKCVA
jgi:hypothetical protein